MSSLPDDRDHPQRDRHHDMVEVHASTQDPRLDIVARAEMRFERINGAGFDLLGDGARRKDG